MSGEILSKAHGAVFEIALNRPEHGNAVTDAMAVELTRLVENPPESAELILIKGAGADFCVGRATMGAARPPGPQDALRRRKDNDVVFAAYGAIRRSPLPVIGVVQGKAFGFGCAIAAVCDITLAGDRARFQVPELAHNILPTMVMSSFIDRVPRKGFSYLVYSQAVIEPALALSFGIVSEVVPQAELDKAVAALTAAILKAPRAAIRGVKEFTARAFDMPLEGAIDYARNLHATINASEEMRRK